jgi:hypothetical protein
MQQISLDKVKEFNQTTLVNSHHDDCLPEGYSYGSDIDDDNLPDPDQNFSEPVYDPCDDPDSPYFRLPFNDDLSATVSVEPTETLSKTLRGDIVDDDGWCTTDIPEGSHSVAGDVLERLSTEDPLPDWDDGDILDDGDIQDDEELQNGDEMLPDFDSYKF